MLTLSSEPKVIHKIPIESGVTGFCVEKAGEATERKQAHYRHLTPRVQSSLFRPFRLNFICSTASLWALSFVRVGRYTGKVSEDSCHEFEQNNFVYNT